MMTSEEKLAGKKIAIVATDGFEEDELFEPKKALEAAGATVEIVSSVPGKIRGWRKQDWTEAVEVDRQIADADSDDYDALVLPGGVINADKLRREQAIIEFVAEFVDQGKPIAAICHAPWVLIETKAVAGRRMTSWPSLQTDIRNAGAEWVDEEVVTDNGWVTSRMPADIPAFNKKMIEEFGEAEHKPVQSRRKDTSAPSIEDLY